MTEINEDERNLLSFEIRHIPSFIAKKARDELKETPEVSSRCLTELKQLASADSVTEDTEFEDDFLLQFLRRNKFDVGRAFKNLKKFLQQRRSQPAVFESLSPDDQNVLDFSRCFGFSPLRTPEGCTVVVSHIGNVVAENVSVLDLERMIVAIFLQLLRDPVAQVSGFKLIHDVSGWSAKTLKYVSPRTAVFFYQMSMQCLPGRWKEIHIIGCSRVFQLMWSIVGRLLSRKMRNRVFIHQNVEELEDYFPMEVLPAEFGGKAKLMDSQSWLIKAHQDLKNLPKGGLPNLF